MVPSFVASEWTNAQLVDIECANVFDGIRNTLCILLVTILVSIHSYSAGIIIVQKLSGLTIADFLHDPRYALTLTQVGLICDI